MPQIVTGYERALLTDVLRVWTFSEDNMEVLRAAIEMRRRFRRFDSLRQKGKENRDHHTPNKEL